MSTARFIVGDSLEVMRTLPDASVDLVLTSPPFLALRSYLPADHPDKAKEMGSEPTPGEFIDALLDIVEECRRVLAPHGSIAFELGDTYSGSGGAGGDYTDTGLRAGQEKFTGSAIQHRRSAQRNRKVGKLADYSDGRGNPDGMRDTTFSGANTRTGGGDGWPLAKSLCLIPELFRVALVYGFNPLTGRQTPRWRARNVVRWCRPNPPVGALGDKVRPATSDIIIACVGGKRYFDLDAERTPQTEPDRVYRNTDRKVHLAPHREGKDIVTNANGAPPLDWWEIATQPYAGSHYATMPPEIPRRLISLMCPPRVCRVCGLPSSRVVSSLTPMREASTTRDDGKRDAPLGIGLPPEKGWEYERETVGWTDCGHDDYRPGLVLDPFAGSGTTLAVATGHGRDAIGIDLDRRNVELARQRVGMFLEVDGEDSAPQVADVATGGAL